jgi:hypothetical protein
MGGGWGSDKYLFGVHSASFQGRIVLSGRSKGSGEGVADILADWLMHASVPSSESSSSTTSESQDIFWGQTNLETRKGNLLSKSSLSKVHTGR